MSGTFWGMGGDDGTLVVLRKSCKREIQNDNQQIEILNSPLGIAFSLLQAIRLIIDGWWESLNK